MVATPARPPIPMVATHLAFYHIGIACILWDASWITLGYIELLIHDYCYIITGWWFGT